ncbi:hypothetical protein LNP17_07980 [Klebsiella variicola subsp. variicola]|nr:hypothetical protein [Klebsiella variicola subsp. variicola]
MQGRCLGPTRSLQEISRRHHAVAMLLAGARGVQGRRRLAAPVRSLRHE